MGNLFKGLIFSLELPQQRDLESRAQGYDAFVRAGGLFPKRWLGGLFRSVAERLDSIDYPYAACAARREATRMIEVLRWNDPADPRRLVRAPSWLEKAPAQLAARRRRARRARAARESR